MWRPLTKPGNSKPAEQVVEQLYRCQVSSRFPSRIPQRCAQGRTALRVAIPPCEPAPRPSSASRLEKQSNHQKSNSRSATANIEKKKIWIPYTKIRPQPIEPPTTNGDRNKVSNKPHVQDTSSFSIKQKPIPTPAQSKKTSIEPLMQDIKKSKPVTVVPVSKKQLLHKPATEKRESEVVNSNNVKDVVLTVKDYVTGIKSKEIVSDQNLDWDERITEYERTKNELQEKQTIIMQQYADLQIVHDKMKNQNNNVKLPPSEDLKVLNVANLSPEQLLKMCATTEEYFPNNDFIGMDVPLDVNKLYSLAGNLLITCQDTLTKRQEIIDWLESLLKTYPQKKDLQGPLCKIEIFQGIKMKTLVSKIHEISKENNTLKSLLEQRKSDFLSEVEEITECLRKGVNHTMSLQLKNEELSYELSELNAQTADLRKKLLAAESYKSHGNKIKIEEIERLLQEEKYKNGIINDRLSRADAQVKMATKRTEQLETALDKARAQIWTLDRAAQDLRNQNEKIQSDFDKELTRFTDSIQETTSQIQQIAEAREKLQAEKENLEKRIEELSYQHNKAMEQMVQELNGNQRKLTETEKKYKDEVDEKKRLEIKVESLHKKLVESESQCKEIFRELKEKDEVLCKALALQSELSTIKTELEEAKFEAENYKKKVLHQSETITEVKRSLEENLKAEKNMKSELRNKDEYILELERKQSILEQELQSSKSRTNSYEHQLASLEQHFNKLREVFGDFSNCNELSDMVHQQRSKLQEVIRQNEQLSEELQNKDADLKKFEERIKSQERVLNQKDEVLEMLCKKDNEHTNAIKNLQNHLEIRSRDESFLHQKLNEKSNELKCLGTNIENQNLHISELETFVKALEDQTQHANFQRNIDLEVINALKAKIEEYEAYFMEVEQDSDIPVENVDTLINILEDEFRLPFDPLKPLLGRNSEYTESIIKPVQNRSKTNTTNQMHSRNFSVTQEVKQPLRHQREQENMPTKLLGDDNKCYYKTTYLHKHAEQSEREKNQRDHELKRRPYTASSVYGCSTLPVSPPGARQAVSTAKSNQGAMSFENNHFRNERQSKMLKLACHRIKD